MQGKTRSISYIERTNSDISKFSIQYPALTLLGVGYRVKSCETSRIEFDTDKKTNGYDFDI